jgi:Flp pilus assembly protein TadG
MKQRSLMSDQRGAAVVEFALAIPVLIVGLMSVMHIGMLYHANSGIRELTSWAGRTAIIEYQSAAHPTDAAFKARIVDRVRTGGYGMDASRLQAAVAVATNATDGWRSVTITLSYPFRINIPLLPAVTVNLRQQKVYYAPIV